MPLQPDLPFPKARGIRAEDWNETVFAGAVAGNLAAGSVASDKIERYRVDDTRAAGVQGVVVWD